MEIKRYLIGAGALIIVFVLGRYSGPAKVEVKEVEKIVYSQNESSDRNQRVTETQKETRLPDGTIVKEWKREKDTSTQKEKEISQESVKIVSSKTEARPDFRLGAIYEPAIINFQKASYSVMVERRIFSELYLGLSVSSNKTVGLVVSLGF